MGVICSYQSVQPQQQPHNTLIHMDIPNYITVPALCIAIIASFATLLRSVYPDESLWSLKDETTTTRPRHTGRKGAVSNRGARSRVKPIARKTAQRRRK